MESTTQGKIKKMQSAINELQLVFGELLTERLIPVIEKITELANRFSDLDVGTQNTIINVLGIAAAFGVLLLAVAGIVSLLGILGSAFVSVAGFFAPVIAAFLTFDGLMTVITGGLVYLITSITNATIESEKLAKAQAKVNKEYEDFSRFILTAPTNVQALVQGDIKRNEQLKLENARIERNNALSRKRLTTAQQFMKLMESSTLDTGDSSETQLRGGRPNMDDIPAREPLSRFGVELGLAAEQIVILNQLGTDMLSNFADGFVNLFEKQTRYVEINGVMQEQTISFGEKFGTFASQFLIDIAKMIAKTAILAGLLQLTGLGTAKSFGGNFMNILGFADGGRPPVGRPSIVGERGPELFVPGSSGTIIPNHALGGGGAAAIPDVRISGDDLLIVFDRANRRKGYR